MGLSKGRILRYVLYGVEILLTWIVQETPYCLPEVFGGKAVLLIPLALSFAVFEKEIPAMVSAVVCGLLTDCSYSGPIGFYVIGLVIACFAVSTAYQGYIRRSMLTVMLMAGIVIPVLLTMQFLFYYVFAGYADSGYMFLKHYVSRILYTFAVMPVYYSINQTLLVRKGQR